jgi:hypothetical protein
MNILKSEIKLFKASAVLSQLRAALPQKSANANTALERSIGKA